MNLDGSGYSLSNVLNCRGRRLVFSASTEGYFCLNKSHSVDARKNVFVISCVLESSIIWICPQGSVVMHVVGRGPLFKGGVGMFHGAWVPLPYGPLRGPMRQLNPSSMGHSILVLPWTRTPGPAGCMARTLVAVHATEPRFSMSDTSGHGSDRKWGYWWGWLLSNHRPSYGMYPAACRRVHSRVRSVVDVSLPPLPSKTQWRTSC